ncbi:MAG: PE-PPE domain-containing protein [Mycobacterium sp.]
MELTALITPANSTAQIFASSDYYNQNWSSYGDPPVVVPFFLGPQGIVRAIRSNADDDPTTQTIAVLASGWGAGQTGTALAILKANDDPAIDDIDLVVLDNNTHRPGGGFWTTYSAFAPLLLTSGDPTPSDTGIPVLDVGYDYNINGNAPTYPINLLADANSLVAYVLDYGGEATAPVPEDIINEAKNPDGPHYHYVLNEDGSIAKDENGKEMKYLLEKSSTTYVTFKSEHLPLVQPLRLIPGGDIVADAIEPTLTVLVNAGYKDNQPIPQDPRIVRRAGLFPSATETSDALGALPGAVKHGLDNVREDLSPGSVVTNSVQQSNGSRTVNALAGNSPAGATPPQVSKPNTNPFKIPNGLKPAPGGKKPSSSTSTGTKNPLRQTITDFRSGLNDLANNLTNGAKKPSDPETPSNPDTPSKPSTGSAP